MSDAAQDTINRAANGEDLGNAGRERLLRKLESLAPLPDAAAQAIRRLEMTVVAYPTHHHLIRETTLPSCCHLLLDGFVCRYKSLPGGDRQVLSFHTPGDILDLQSLYLNHMDFGAITLAPTIVGHLERDAVGSLVHTHPTIGRAFLRDTLVDGAIYREWLLSLGRRSARAHLAHLLCEVSLRLNAVSLPTDAGGANAEFGGELPLAREELADALGLSVVDIVRELHRMRSEGLIALRSTGLQILDHERLALLCDFNPAYLNQVSAA